MLSNARTRVSVMAIVLAMVLALLGSPVLGADPPPDSKSTAAQPPELSPDASTEQRSSDGDSPQPPVEPFVPSESISADSAVAFPVDI